MKLIVAYVRPEQLSDVLVNLEHQLFAIQNAQLTGTVVDVMESGARALRGTLAQVDEERVEAVYDSLAELAEDQQRLDLAIGRSTHRTRLSLFCQRLANEPRCRHQPRRRVQRRA